MGLFNSTNLPENVVLGAVGLTMLVLCADYAVGKLVRLANYFNLSTTFVGMTVVSLATSIPEISAHLTASAGILTGSLDYHIGSAVVIGANYGSDVVQQTLIMAIVIMMAGALIFKRYFIWKSLLPMILTPVITISLALDGNLSRLDGLLCFASFIGYMLFLYVDERKHYIKPAETEEDRPTNAMGAAKDALLALGAMAVTVVAAQIVLTVAEFVVQRTGIAGSLIGVTTLGVASALPELTTAISGLRKGHNGISLGTLVGSNITNPLVGIGAGAMLSTYWVPRPVLLWDMPWQTFGGILLWILLWLTRGKLDRRAALLLIALYIVYIVLRMVLFPAD